MARGGQGIVYTRETRTRADGTEYKAFRKDPFFVDAGSLAKVSMRGFLGPDLAKLATMFPDFTRKALSSVGWHMQKAIRADIDKGGPDGTHWAPLSPVHVGRLLDKAMYGRKSGRRRGKFFGQLFYPVAYFRYPLPAMRVDIGWLSASAARFGGLLQRGASVPVSKRTRRLYARAGRKVGRGPLPIPPRPLMAESWAAHEGEMTELFGSKMARYKEASVDWLAETTSNAAQATGLAA